MVHRFLRGNTQREVAHGLCCQLVEHSETIQIDVAQLVPLLLGLAAVPSFVFREVAHRRQEHRQHQRPTDRHHSLTKSLTYFPIGCIRQKLPETTT